MPIANCSKKHYNAHEKKEMPFKDFISAWEHSLSANGLFNSIVVH